jgi:hypothetical protein
MRKKQIDSQNQSKRSNSPTARTNLRTNKATNNGDTIDQGIKGKISNSPNKRYASVGVDGSFSGRGGHNRTGSRNEFREAKIQIERAKSPKTGTGKKLIREQMSLEEIKWRMKKLFQYYTTFGDRTNMSLLKSNKFNKMMHDAGIGQILSSETVDILFM